MGYERHYTEGSEAELDAQALKDFREYVGEKAWAVALEERDKCTMMHHLDQLNMAISFAGVVGRPVLAFFRQKWGAHLVEVWRSKATWDRRHFDMIRDNIVPTEIRDWIVEGNSKEDLVAWIWELMPLEQRVTMERDILGTIELCERETAEADNGNS